MENFSYNLLNNFDETKISIKIIPLRKKQYHLIWFMPYSLIYSLATIKKWDAVYIGDGVLCVIGFFIKLISPKTKVIVSVYGLDITYGNKLYQAYLKLFYGKLDKYICISKETEKEFLKRGGKNSVVIPPGVGINKFENIKKNKCFREKYSLGKNTLVLITVGRLVKRKGAAWFIENVMVRLRDKDIHYFIAGDGEEREKVKAIINKYDLWDKITLLGRVSDAELDELYVNSNVFIMPNIKVENDMEGFGLVAIEASLAGLIVLASGIEGIKDAVIDGKNGFLLKSSDADMYYKKICDIGDNIEKYNGFINESIEFTKANFSWKEVCNKYIDII